MLLAGDVAEILTALRADRPLSDHRRAPRVGLRARVSIVVRGASKPEEVWMRNISAGGVGLLHSRRLVIGDAFLLRLPTRGQQYVSIQCEAVHCHPMATSLFRLGARFISEPFKEPLMILNSNPATALTSNALTEPELESLRKVIVT